ncbi:MAG: hypothetical protein ACOYIP_02220 [Coriobacteriales bacterium]|jgi:hypothetical protein
MRKILAAVLCMMACAALVGLAGCGSSQTDGQGSDGAELRSAFTGEWLLYEVDCQSPDFFSFGPEEVVDADMDTNYALTLNDDGSASWNGGSVVWDASTGPIECTWEANDATSMTISVDNDGEFRDEGGAINGRLEGDMLVLEFQGEDGEYKYKRAGDAAQAIQADEGESDGASAAGPLSTSDFAVKDLKIEQSYTNGYTITGTLTNNGSKDAGRVVYELSFTEHETDDYGDEVTSVRSKDPYSMTPKVIGNTFYDMKAGEERPFSLVLYNDNFLPTTDPVITITEVLPGADSNSSTVQFGYDEFDVALSYNRGLERCEATITSKLDVPIKNCKLHYAYLGKYGGIAENSEGTWEEAEYLATKPFGPNDSERIWPGKTFECTPEANNVPRENLLFLGMTYEIDEEGSASNVWDEFTVDVDEDAQVVKVTNNTDHYLESVHLDGAATDSSGTRNMVTWTAEHVGPGKTVEATSTGYLSGYYDINIFDIAYTVDEEKEGQMAG